MTRQEALRELRLRADNPSPQEIVSAYDRLARRYPRHHFPERASRLQQAREVLGHPERQFRDIMMGDVLDLSWLDSYRTDSTTGGPNPPEYEPREALAAIVRPTLLRLGSLEHGAASEGMDGDLAEMLASLLDD